jgi:hypothetical protein
LIGTTDCSPTTGHLSRAVVGIFSCDTGAPTGSCTGGSADANGLPLQWPGCYEPWQTTIAPVIVDGCGAAQDDPPACKAGASSNDLRRSNAGLVGDPVDLRTGALSLDPLDVTVSRSGSATARRAGRCQGIMRICGTRSRIGTKAEEVIRRVGVKDKAARVRQKATTPAIQFWGAKARRTQSSTI